VLVPGTRHEQRLVLLHGHAARLAVHGPDDERVVVRDDIGCDDHLRALEHDGRPVSDLGGLVLAGHGANRHVDRLVPVGQRQRGHLVTTYGGAPVGEPDSRRQTDRAVGCDVDAEAGADASEPHDATEVVPRGRGDRLRVVEVCRCDA
jgi:hypothetical protein